MSVLIAITAATSLAGCGNSNRTATGNNVQIIATSPTSPTSPRSGLVTSADGAFRTIVPSGLRYSPPAKTPPGGTDVEYVASTANGEAFQSVTVTRRPLGDQTPAAAIAAVVDTVRHAPGVGRTTALTRAPAPQGARAWQFRAAPPNQPPELVEQTFIVHKSSLYIAMAAASTADFNGVEKRAASMLAAWRWT